LAKHGEGEIDLQRFLAAETKDVIGVENSIFELSRLVSGLAAVDGAVVMNKRFELIGFGAEVSGELPYPDIVEQALDVEGERRSAEPANAVGTRHRAAVGISEETDALALIISEETGAISVADRGVLTTDLTARTLEELLHRLVRTNVDARRTRTALSPVTAAHRKTRSK
jgi:DNA integrity scanning protein DisA with diadenylate cyclase activity